MARKSYGWFERRRRGKVLDLAQGQISKALDTVSFFNEAVQCFSRGDGEGFMRFFDNLLRVEREVDGLRTEVFKELSKGTALVAEYREDLMNLVNRLDQFADYVKDAARCLKMLLGVVVPGGLLGKVVVGSGLLLDCAQALRGSISNIAVDPGEALVGAKRVEEFEDKLDGVYLEAKSLLIRFSDEMKCGSMIVFDDLIEFIEYAADMCADTADYIVILSSDQA